jgi:ADP-ribose pyrophosphatase YjhB (NUDIX family)
MLQKIIGKIWRVSPQIFRAYFVRFTQDTFTVSVGAIVTNDEGKVLLLDHVLRPASGWGVPGGFINYSEQPDEAVKREIVEEIGLEIKNLELVRIRTIKRHIEILFRASASGEGQIKSMEIKQIGWFAPDKMPQEMSEAQKKLIRQVLDGQNARN